MLTGDTRSSLWAKSNAPEFCEGVRCYLWRTAIHPFTVKRSRVLNRLTGPLYSLYCRYPDRFIDEAVRAASYIVVESGLGAILLPRLRSLNRTAKLVYYASDNLDMIGTHPIVQHSLERCGSIVDHVCLASARMGPRFGWAAGRAYVVPHGIDPDDFSGDPPNPYRTELNAVSVGSGLFDPWFFVCAAPIFSDIDFHVIGAGTRFPAAPNVHCYDQMRYKDIVP